MSTSVSNPEAVTTEEQLLKVREPIPFTPTKRLQRDDVLYVTEEDIPHPLYGYARSHKEYSVIDLRGYRKGYEPRLEIRGIYTPNPEDIFRVGTGKLPPYQPTTTGDELLAEMRRLGVHKAFRIDKPSPMAAGGNPLVMMTEPIGTCYENAWRYLIRQKEGKLIHGTVFIKDRRIGHAWVELPTGYIWEPQSGDYYTSVGFDSVFAPVKEHSYTDEQAAIMATRTKNLGPWTKEEKEQFLKRGMMTEPWQIPDLAKKHSNPEAVPEVARVTGKARFVPNLLGIAEESTNELVATLNDLPTDVRGTFDGMLRFLDEYAQLATRGEAYSDVSVNTLYETISGYRDDIGLAFGRPNEVFIERFNEAEANPTRANKVIAIDAFVSLIHERGAAIPVIFGKGLKRATGRGIGSVRERIFQDVTENVNDILDDLAKPPAVGGNPVKELITKEEAIGLLERLSMTPGEAARSLVADEAERREIIQTVQQRVKGEQNKWAPFDPREGPPLPRIFAGLRWPWRKP